MKRLFSFCAVVAVLISTGCSNNSTESNSPDSTVVMDAPPPPTVDSHAHPTEGPHHGTLIELGNEEYHAELVHDEQSVTIYLLDGSATKATPIDAAEVTINLVHDDKPEQFKLAANPDANDPVGKSSRFILQSAELVEELEHDHGAEKLSVLIGGKAYRGEIHHDHAGHDHKH